MFSYEEQARQYKFPRCIFNLELIWYSLQEYYSDSLLKSFSAQKIIFGDMPVRLGTPKLPGLRNQLLGIQALFPTSLNIARTSR